MIFSSTLREVDQNQISLRKKMIQQDIFTHFEIFKHTAAILFVIDHGRAGNVFFKRIFDTHDEVLSISCVAYLYSHYLNYFGDRNHVTGEEAYSWTFNYTNVSMLRVHSDEETQRSLNRIGHDTEISIDRELFEKIISTLVRKKESISRNDLIFSIHFAYALAGSRDIGKIKYILLDDSSQASNSHDGTGDNTIFGMIKSDNQNFRIIHLVRDPRASFSSLRHQYVNRWTMYPIKAPLYLLRIAWCNSVLLWILRYTTAGARYMDDWKRQLSKDNFFQIRNEDLNCNFISTMKILTNWLKITWYEPWSSPDYVPTADGKPWKGISAYSKSFTPMGMDVIPFETDGEAKENRLPGPNREVTERWKKQLLPREVRLIESIYYQELVDLNYAPIYVTSEKMRYKEFLKNFLYLTRGEFPKFSWLIRMCGNKKGLTKIVLFLMLFPCAFLVSRFALFTMYFSGRLSPR